ncbi:hypothetical protein EW145_g4709 [Phellinidium pouzarii]|uniref:Uncharacterized protein n=1 Tax=Phellinidium pouzarii TaxID=167371 RepID=A0A4S4L2R0_9AGAM|nr:hypothetical protein EW145_g4709 [Phellinidium pouzarii]
MNAPLPGLILDLIPSVIEILGPPTTIAHPFNLDLHVSAHVVVLLVVAGLFYLRWKKPDAVRPFKCKAKHDLTDQL